MAEEKIGHIVVYVYVLQNLLLSENVFILFIHILQSEPAGRILELCILHLAMSEIAVLGTRHQIVINEVIYSLPLLSEFAYLFFGVLVSISTVLITYGYL